MPPSGVDEGRAELSEPVGDVTGSEVGTAVGSTESVGCGSVLLLVSAPVDVSQGSVSGAEEADVVVGDPIEVVSVPVGFELVPLPLMRKSFTFLS